MEEPKRRHSWTLKLQCDTHGDLLTSLRSLLFEAQSRECFPQGISGGSGAGYIVSYEENTGQTPEGYFAELEEYLAWCKSKREAPDAE